MTPEQQENGQGPICERCYGPLRYVKGHPDDRPSWTCDTCDGQLTEAEVGWLVDCKRAGFDPVEEIQKLRSQITVAKPSIDEAVIALSRFSVTEQAWHSLGVEQRALVSRVYDAVVKAQEALMSEIEKEALRGV